MIETLQKHVGKPEKVRLSMCIPRERRLDGYILKVSNSLVLLHLFDDFEPDGYCIVRMEHIESVRRSPYEEWWDYMLASEGLLGGLQSPVDIDLQDMGTAIKSICHAGHQMIVHCEDLKDNVEDFYIGICVAVRTTDVLFRDYDALGFWRKEPVVISLDEVSKVEFATPYIRTFSKYTRSK